MSAVWWLAIAGLPVFHQPLPESPGEPAAIALAAGRIPLRAPCYSLFCGDAEWLEPSRYTRLQRPATPGALPEIAPIKASPLASRRYVHLHSPASRRDWVGASANHALVDTRYGFQAIRTPDTQLQLEMGTGYRLEPYADFGTAVPGPVARGRVQLSQHFGERARLTQQMQVETGRANTTVRQTLGVDLRLRPQWTLRSDVEMRHDSGVDGGQGRTDTESSLKLKYAF